MTFSDLILILRQDYLDDAEEPYLWSNAALLRYLREAEKQACMRGNLLFDKTTPSVCEIALTNGVQSYAFSPKLTKITAVFWHGQPVTHTTPDNLDALLPTWRIADGTSIQNKALYYVIQGRNINLAPIPNTADALLSPLRIEGYRLPISDEAETPEIPEEFHHDLIYYALHKAYAKNDSDTKDELKAKEHLFYFDALYGAEVTSKVRQHQFEQPRAGSIRPVMPDNSFNSESWE